jgi:hypothetical protein
MYWGGGEGWVCAKSEYTRKSNEIERRPQTNERTVGEIRKIE